MHIDIESDFQLLQLHAAMSYSLDSSNRLLHINDGLRSNAPRFWFGSSKLGNLWFCNRDVSIEAALALDELCAQEEPLSNSASYPIGRPLILEALNSPEESYCGPLYVFPYNATTPEGVVELNKDNSELLGEELQDWKDAAGQMPCVVSLETGIAASVCASSLISNSAQAAGLETAPSHRKKGHALKATLGWASLVQRQGAMAFYGTRWGNLASQRVAEQLGLRQFGWEFYVN